MAHSAHSFFLCFFSLLFVKLTRALQESRELSTICGQQSGYLVAFFSSASGRQALILGHGTSAASLKSSPSTSAFTSARSGPLAQEPTSDRIIRPGQRIGSLSSVTGSDPVFAIVQQVAVEVSLQCFRPWSFR
jgi:hypothetical protein